MGEAVALNKDVFRVKKDSETFLLFEKHKAEKKVVQQTFDRIDLEDDIDKDDIGLWTSDMIGVVTGSKTYKKHREDMSKKTEGRYTILLKRSPLFKRLLDLTQGALDLNEGTSYKWHINTYYGINNCDGTHLLDGELYISIRDLSGTQKEAFETLEEVSYADYLRKVADNYDN